MVIVEALDFGGDGKVARKMQDKLKSILPEASLFLASLDDDLSKYASPSLPFPPLLCCWLTTLSPSAVSAVVWQSDVVRHLLCLSCRCWSRLQGLV
jgi:hypothetical protein